jgi:amino acid permease
MDVEKNKTRLKLVLISILVLILLIIVSPWLFVDEWLGFSENFLQGTFSVLGFLIIIYLWSQFNKLRIEINKDELEDKDLTELEKEMERRANSEPSNNK